MQGGETVVRMDSVIQESIFNFFKKSSIVFLQLLF